MNWTPKLIYNAITITLDNPPEGDPLSEDIRSFGAEAISRSGVEQYNEFYQRETITVKLKKVSKTNLDLLRTFFKTWGALGKAFDWYSSEDEAAFNTYRLDRKEMKIKRTSPDGADDFYYAVTFRMRRVL